MKKNKASYFVGIAFICIVAFFLCSVFYRVYRVKRYYDYGANASETATAASEDNDTSTQDPNALTWPDIYPFSDEYKFVPTETEETQNAEDDADDDSGKASAYLSYVNTFKNSIEYYTTKLLPGRMKYIEANAWFNKRVGMNIVSGSDDVVVMKNGYLTFESGAAEDMTEQAESVEWFSDIMKQKGVDFLYVQYPTKEKKGDNMLPDGIEDGYNEMADDILERLKKGGVSCFDIRNSLMQKGDDWYSNFFITDHHWKPETGVWAAGELVKKLNSEFGYSFDSDIGNLDNYNIEVYQKCQFGAQGKIATTAFAEPEDISIIYPKGDTSLTVKYNIDEPKTGRFEDVIFNKEHLNSTDYYNYSAYAAYLDGNKALTQITNNSLKNGKRILIIGDSFNKSVAPYLSQVFDQVDLLDRRYFDGSVISYVEKTKPDIVIVAYTASIKGGVKGHQGIFNFE